MEKLTEMHVEHFGAQTESSVQLPFSTSGDRIQGLPVNSHIHRYSYVLYLYIAYAHLHMYLNHTGHFKEASYIISLTE